MLESRPGSAVVAIMGGIVLVCGVLAPSPLLAQSNKAQNLFAKAVDELQAGSVQQAASDFERGLKIEPNNLTAKFYYAETLQTLGQALNAVPYYLEIAESNDLALRAKIREPLSRLASVAFSGEATHQVHILYGQGQQSGPFVAINRYFPGNFLVPHFHNQVWKEYVVSGTLWSGFDPRGDQSSTTPIREGSLVVTPPQTIHFEGSRQTDSGPVTVLVFTQNPNITTIVGANGLPAR